MSSAQRKSIYVLGHRNHPIEASYSRKAPLQLQLQKEKKEKKNNGINLSMAVCYFLVLDLSFRQKPLER